MESQLPNDPDALLSRAELARILPISHQTLARWAHERRGPPYLKLGTRVAYRVGDVREWLTRQPRVEHAER
jgi:predicted DNA-binding transcriptional regulator AlpA